MSKLYHVQKERYEVGDLVAMRLSTKDGDTQRYGYGVVVRLEPNKKHPDNPKEHYAVVRLIGDETINGLVRRFSHKDVFFLNKEEAPNVQ